MKRLTVFESSIIGFFIGVIVSTYILCVESTGGVIGQVLGAVSLRPLLDSFTVPGYLALAVDFVFYVAVYAVYGAIAGFLIKKSTKMIFLVIALVIVFIVAAFLEQRSLLSAPSLTASVYEAVQTVPTQSVKPAQQYFGTEAVGDLNGDGKDDIAFILSRSDPERGMLYYLSAALATTTGHEGTNLVFLGNDVVPQTISITGGIITVPYVASSDKTSTTDYFYAQVVDGTLEQIDLKDKDDSLVWGTVSADKNIILFEPCNEDSSLVLDGSSTMIELIQNELNKIASTSAQPPNVFAALIGKSHTLLIRDASSSPYSAGFSVDAVINFTTESVCS